MGCLLIIIGWLLFTSTVVFDAPTVGLILIILGIAWPNDEKKS